MTCIIAAVNNNKVHMVGDSGGAEGWNVSIITQPKVFRNGDYVIGYTSSFRMGQILQFANLPQWDNAKRLDEFMVTVFIPAVRELLKAGGFVKIENAVEEGGAFLVGIAGRLFMCSSDFTVLERAIGFDAVGCGSDFALGAYLALRDIMDVKERLFKAIEISAYFSGPIRAPYHYESV
jgi:ATP-dependent protease HslVU (ClpYQ) peptidase subunit